MATVTFEQVAEFAVERLWPLDKKITQATSLTHDFRIAGLDGKEFMEAFAARFNVDLGDFDWVQCFGLEAGGNPIGLIGYFYKRLVLGIAARDLVELPNITLGHLVTCAQLRKWLRPK